MSTIWKSPPAMVALKMDKCTIGRASDNTVILSEVSVSRHHCVIEKKRNRWTLKDTSANGMYLNLESVRKNVRLKLKNCDVISLTDKINYCFHNNIVDGESQAELVQIDDLEETDIYFNGEPPQLEEEEEAPQTSQSQPKADASLDTMKEELTCSICKEIFIKPTVLKCLHTFCSFCITSSRAKSSFCPVCHQKICREPITSLVIDNCCRQVCIGFTEDEQRRREKMIKERAAAMADLRTMIPSTQRGRRRRNRRHQQRAEVSHIHELSETDTNLSSANGYDELWFQHEYVNGFSGLPGARRVPYDTCHVCHLTGHWASGCPNR